MIDARQTAAANAQQEQADTQQQQITDQQKQIDATQKTVSALGDAQTSAHYQEMVNARLSAQNDANARTAAEQKQKIDTLATNQKRNNISIVCSTGNKFSVWRKTQRKRMNKLTA